MVPENLGMGFGISATDEGLSPHQLMTFSRTVG